MNTLKYLEYLVFDTPRHSCQGGELVCRHLTVHSSQVGEQGRFTNRWKSNKPNPRISGLSHLETVLSC